MFLDWKIWRNRKDTETDTKKDTEKDTDRNTDEEIDTENNLRDIQTITENRLTSYQIYYQKISSYFPCAQTAHNLQ